MAPGRDKRPEGLGLPGMSDAVSGEEIRQRINTLYDRAETDSGTYNATRAMSVGDRRTGRPARPAQRKPSDPALDAVARKWFDGVRANAGPTVAAVLPADRMPAPSARPAPAPAPELPAAIPAPRPELEAPARRAPELTAGPIAPIAALPAAPESPRDAFPALPAAPSALPAGPLAAAPAVAPALAVTPAPVPALAATPVADTAARQIARRSAKGQNQEKLTQARRLLTRQVALRTAPPVPESAPAAAPGWPVPEQDPLFGEGTGWLTQPSPAPGPLAPGPLAGGGQYPSAPGATGQFGTVPSVAGYPNTPIDTGQFSLPLDAAMTNPPADTGQFNAIPSVAAYPNTPVDTGQFSLPFEAGLTNPPADTGQFSAVPSMGAYPSAPVATGYPSAPASPAYPGAPADVGYPGTPADPAYPSAPVTAAYPSAPVSPGYPSAPAVAAYPGNPADTGQFALMDTGQFAAPAMAAMPTAPAMPAMPAAPAPVGVPEPAGYDGKAAKAIEFARAQIGRPCLWGATGPESYDCSSLTQAAWRAAGVALPRTAADQARTVSAIPLTDLQPGDLIFFHGDTSHVGVCAGPGTMIHAPGPGALI
ncbi:NlpC/P60 family protein, partial [Streptomyces sp. NPDC059766]|uniref:C40 family peptidase n=1 Tax=Streptomyces sp. NPDC059766 TaxID=3346940 RepID=UPI00365FA930